MKVCGLNFIDPYNFLLCALAKMPAAFRLSELKKDTPHFFKAAESVT
jgi:hypothetical protein